MALAERIESKVHKQAAGVGGRVLRAQGAKKGGASLKSLTLAPNIIAKKATHAICCETLKCTYTQQNTSRRSSNICSFRLSECKLSLH